MGNREWGIGCARNLNPRHFFPVSEAMKTSYFFLSRFRGYENLYFFLSRFRGYENPIFFLSHFRGYENPIFFF
jgi:hypothetical protein